jgi:hypothetical protein
MKKFYCILLALLMAFSAAACNGPESGKPGPDDPGKDPPATETLKAEIWTLPSSVKVLREADCSSHYEENASLEYAMAKNEYESMQLMITPETDIAAYELAVTGLTNGNGGEIPAENIQVYNEFYVYVKKGTAPDSKRPAGWYPDALIPQDLSAAFGENKIAAGDNQGIWITVKTEKETPAGEYTGAFSLSLDGQKYDVPVTVTVWDFTVPDEVHARNSFYLFQDELSNGQWDNTKESYQKYVDYFLDYRISTTEIASLDYNTEDWVEQVKKYAADPRVTSYNVHGDGHYGMTLLKALIENSTPELNLLDKAFFYLFDEPYTMLEQASETYYRKIDELIALADSYTEEELAEYGLTKADIEGVEVMITLTASINTIEGLRTYCALASDFDTQSMRDRYEEYRKNPYLGKNNELAGTDYGTTWWYVCVHPYDPYPNFNIDMDLSAARVLSWMQYDYDIEGLIYWGTMTYFSSATRFDQDGQKPVNVYEQADGVFAGANGDGYLVYPGAKYGTDTPIPTMRLMELRDGFEEYEFLYLLENEVNDALAEHNFKGSFDEIMADIYATLYRGAVPEQDYTLVLEARAKVAEMITAIQKDSSAVKNYL